MISRFAAMTSNPTTDRQANALFCKTNAHRVRSPARFTFDKALQNLGQYLTIFYFLYIINPHITLIS